MWREAVIRLEIQERLDNSLYVSSPDLPYLHVIAPNWNELHSMVPPMVKELLERNHKIKAEVRIVDVLASEGGSTKLPAPHVIAQASM